MNFLGFLARRSGRMMVLACVLGLAACSGPSHNGQPVITQPLPLTESQRAAHLASFDQVWTTIHDTHWDPAVVGESWERARAGLRPRVEAAGTAEEARGAIRDLLGRLGESHFALIPSSSYAGLDPAENDEVAGTGEIGASVRAVDGDALVVAVRADSPAAQAGVRPGMILTRIGTSDVRRLLSAADSPTLSGALRPVMLSRAVEARLSGPVGSEVALTLLAEGDSAKTVRVRRETPAGRPSQFGNLPSMYVTFDRRRVGERLDVGYVSLSAFLDMPRVLADFASAVESFQDTSGMIIDLRGNPGGIGLMAMAMGGWFITKPDQRLGTLRTRALELNFVLQPRSTPYSGPLAILVDECSLSTSEILAGGLQDLGRARVFGLKTGGAALPSVIERLPNGDGFQHALADYTSVAGRRLEGEGVTPDVTVPYDRRALLSGRDPVLEAAIAWIGSRAP